VGKLVVSEFVTLDGVFEDPGGAEDFERGGWAFDFDRGPEGDRFKLDELMAAGALLLGRVTYEGFARAWPSRTDDVGFAERMNGLPKYVVSTTLERTDWSNSTLMRDARQVRTISDEVDGDLLVNGSGRLVEALMAEDLVDEYRLMVFPVVLGTGRKLFGATAAKLRLAGTQKAGETVILRYVR